MTDQPTPWHHMRLPAQPDTLAPDGSEIRLLPALAGGSMVHCTLPPGATSLAVAHRTVEELWYVVGGTGELWRRMGDAGNVDAGNVDAGQVDAGQVDALMPGVALSIPLGTHFQFRNPGAAPLEIIIVTLPPWPGAEEAYRVPDHWPVAGQ